MPKGYWIAQVDLHDPEPYRGYMEANAVPFAKFGARFLVRGAARAERLEGHMRDRLVVLEFADYATALACYHSPEYADALRLRQRCSTGDVVIVEGYDGPQPALHGM